MNQSKALHSAFDTAVYYITFKDRSRKELCDKLKMKGYSLQEIDEAMDKLLEYGYINDERYALSYINSNVHKKGDRLITRELLDKGISPSTITRHLTNKERDESEVILDILERRYGSADFSDEKQLRRIYGFFARRGFAYDNISKSVSLFRNMH